MGLWCWVWTFGLCGRTGFDWFCVRCRGVGSFAELYDSDGGCWGMVWLTGLWCIDFCGVYMSRFDFTCWGLECFLRSDELGVAGFLGFWV